MSIIKKVSFFTLIAIFGCNWSSFKKSENTTQGDFYADEMYEKMINYRIELIIEILKERGVHIDSANYSKLNTLGKLDYIKQELRRYRIVDYQVTKMNCESSIVKKDSFYKGSVSLSGFNSNLEWKLLMKYNNELKVISYDTTYDEFKYALKPYRLGENEFEGYLIQGRDTYNFSSTFKVH